MMPGVIEDCVPLLSMDALKVWILNVEFSAFLAHSVPRTVAAKMTFQAGDWKRLSLGNLSKKSLKDPALGVPKDSPAGSC